ncbi:MAG: 5-(carboxyamino)imidazole ribonucleotide synthase [Anaerolineales bacterium]|nr:5-(carboxyamino)imidazole ribonucleotide synthase [Anaerolineales bacterium]
MPLTLGVLGAGQLGRMLALAGYPLGLRFRFLDPAPEAPAGQLAEHLAAEYTDERAWAAFADGLAAITYEFENVPVTAARALAERVPVYPPPAALEAAQDRLSEKRLFQELGLPTPACAPVATRAELEAALAALGWPAVLKTRRLGYDGKGQALLRAPADVEPAWRALAGVPLILEAFIPFERELSLLAVRGRSGETAFYPLVETHHRDGILRLSVVVPGATASADQRQAEDYAARVLRRLDYVGVLAIEFFQHNGRLLANEMAPRVHNSGHWTIEGALTSQFENHLRAVLGWPLGAAAARGPAAMLNLIGDTPAPEAVLRVPGAHLHLYGKAPRPGRKLGHLTVCAETPEALAERLAVLRPLAGFPAELQ